MVIYGNYSKGACFNDELVMHFIAFLSGNLLTKYAS